MTLTNTEYKYIQLDENNVPIIEGTTMKVVELITAKIAYGWSPEELHLNYPHVSLSKVCAALAYYWDHQAEVDAEIERRGKYAEQARREDGPSALSAKIRQMGLLK